ncbi:MAG: hypothetical protein RLZ98_2727 [Pseudomonadota bacterium]|jgi:hypothetical protein
MKSTSQASKGGPTAPIRIALLAAALAASVPSSSASDAFGALIGTWRGEGQVVFEGGQSERLSCNTYYVEKDKGLRLSLVIRCANASAGKIEMRGTLDHLDGKLTGTWEERTFNASGTATGGIAGNQIHLSFAGALNGTLTTLLTNDTQSIFVRSQGSTLSTINIVLKKLGAVQATK